jgi:hypothetical protein
MNIPMPDVDDVKHLEPNPNVYQLLLWWCLARPLPSRVKAVVEQKLTEADDLHREAIETATGLAFFDG